MDVEAASEHNFDCKVVLSSLMDSCRVCMASSLNMSCIFDTEKENIIHEIQFCTGVTIKQEAGLPSLICESCLQNLSVAYKFKKSCLVADETFHKLVVAPSIKVEEPDLSNVEYEEIIEYIDESANEFDEDIKKEMPEIELEPKRVRKNACVKVESSSPIKAHPRKSAAPPKQPRRVKSAAPPKQPRRIKKFKFRKLYCQPCDIKFDTKEQSDEHKMNKHEKEAWVCEVCGKMFNTHGSHYKHVKSHQPPGYYCDLCEYKTWHKNNLVNHIRRHTDGSKLYQCQHCQASYYTSSSLSAHVRRVHMKERPHECTICQRMFFDKTKLNIHVDSHLKIKRFKCDICHSCFTRRCHWKTHLLRQHDIVTPPQKLGRRKLNLFIGEYVDSSKQDVIGEYYKGGGNLYNNKL